MTTSSAIHAYQTVLEEIRHMRPSIDRDQRVQSFLADDAKSPDQVREVFRLLTTEWRGLCEDAGFDVDLLPPVPYADVFFTFHEEDPSSLIPAHFIVASAATSVAAAEMILQTPGVTTVKPNKEWRVLSHPSAVPHLRKFATSFACDFSQAALTQLKSLATQSDSVGTVSYGPRGTLDVSCAIPYPHLAEELSKRVDARLLPDSNVLRVPAAKSRLLQQTLASLGISVTLSDEVNRTWSQLAQALAWDGTMAGLAQVLVSELHGLTASVKKRLYEGGYRTAQQILFVAPRRYVDRSQPQSLTTVTEGEETAVVATVQAVRVMQAKRMVSFTVSDGTQKITVTYFKAPWMAKKFSAGDQVLIYGKVSSWGANKSQRGFTNPLMEHFTDASAAIFGIYPQSSRVSTEDIRAAVWELLDRLPSSPVDGDTGDQKLLSALQDLHRPSHLDKVSPARQVLAYEELLRLQLILAVEKHAEASSAGIVNPVDSDRYASIIDALPYALTGAQALAWKEISEDLCAPRSMHRLLQGDVGSGKTTLALLTLLSAVLNGRQAAVLAPTEILATQLFDTFSKEVESLSAVTNIRMELFTNRLRGKKREETFQALSNGDIQVAVGTHALLSEGVEFQDLSVVVIDEQHRFGVEQRAKLTHSREDSRRPDTLVMTATPIPRTAALTVFGALDVSVLDELPPGRIPIATRWINNTVSLKSSRAEAWKKVREEVEQGHQAYIVCPLVEESQNLQVASAVETFEALSSGALQGLRLGLVHGQMKHEERHEIMSQFRNHEFDVLVATTVIEVGVNIPNASVIVVLDPQRFGMAQLHQLRGRVGRSNIPSTCFLYGKAGSDESARRLSALEASTDGFELSEIDLQIRGPGQMFGTAQSGITDLSIANLLTDEELLIQARDEAKNLVRSEPGEKLRARVGETGLSDTALSWLRKS